MTQADPNRLKAVTEQGFRQMFFAVDRFPKTERLLLGSSDFNVYEIDFATEKPELIPFDGPGHGSYVTGVRLASEYVVSGSYDGRLIWWDAETRKQVRAVEAHEKWIRRVVSSPDGTVVVSVADDMLCKLWDVKSGELLRTVTDHEPVTPHNYPSMLYAVTISPDGRLMATGDKLGHVAVWEFATGEKLAELDCPVMYTWDPRQRRHSIGGVRSLAFTHDARLLAVGGIGQIGNIDHLGGPARIELFDWQAGERLYEIEDDKFKGLVEQIEFHPDGAWFAAVGGDHKGFVSFYETKGGELIHQERAGDHVYGLARNETFDRLYTAHHSRMTVWDLKAEKNTGGQGDEVPQPAVAPKP